MKKILIVIIIFGLLSYLGYKNAINTPLDKNGSDVDFTITSGEGVNQISSNLKEANLINSDFYFKIYVWRQGLEKNFQAGDYILNPNMTMKEIVKILTLGDAIDKEKTITIIEGWDIREINDYLVKEGIIKEQVFSDICNNPKNYKLLVTNYEFFNGKPKNASLEGYLFPDTYRIFKDSTAEDIVQKMLNNFDNKLTQGMRDDIQKQGKSIYEIVTMASILEKEVRSFEDMKIVSGIFWDRIKNSQRLESCATLAYALGVNKDQYTVEDTNIDSPYNTYRNDGLPPGPICNPGLNAIKAAIYPTYTDYNYFLTDPETGQTIYAVTYEQHLRNKAKYLN